MSGKSLMIQGTMSGVGKSLLVAGLCRILAQDGLRVAPFKSQNMALNSCITADGLEMGRAQVMQAEACGIDPEVDMNPVLLKPTTDVGSQVIVRGRPIGQMPAREYFAYKKSLVPVIKESFENLRARFDVVIIEGAGSPAEINLKDDDIVNMGMAKMAQSPVLLVGDIDRGGVFAQLIGTCMLLEPDERAMVRALVVNKFRGDRSILEPGLDMLVERAGVPIAGVVPYVHVDVDDEDSLSDRLSVRSTDALIDVACIRLPRISNFTDLMALDALPQVGVRYVSRAADLGEPDLIVIPGTKSTMADLIWMRERGIEAAVLKCAAAGAPVLGICGGYQMLGREIIDERGVESAGCGGAGTGGTTLRGMGLLPATTVFEPEKHQVRSQGLFAKVRGALSSLSGAAISGYEIHMGRTRVDGEPLCLLGQGADASTWKSEGCQEGNVYGTYLHGLFDSPDVTKRLVGALLAAKGIDAACVEAFDMRAYKQAQYDKLADVMRANMDMDMIYRIIEEGL